MPRPNVFNPELEHSDSDPGGYRCATAKVRAQANAVEVYEIPSQQRLCPYSYEEC